MHMVTFSDEEQVELVEADVPEPSQGEVILRPVACGICGSDLHAWHGKWGEDYRPGHEFCAVVEQVGPGVNDLHTGERVTGECFGHCGECDACRSGHYNHCGNICWNPSRPGGAFAEKLCYRAEALYPVPDGMSHRQAVMVEPLAVAFHAVSLGHICAEESVGIIGAGTIGLLCAAVARAEGASRIFVVAKYEHQAEMASEMGATDVLLAGEQDPREAIPEALGKTGVDLAIDSVAAGTSFTTALALADDRGRVIEVGGITRPLLAALSPMVDRELTVRGSSCYAMTDDRPDFRWAIDLIQERRIQPEKLISHEFPLSDGQKAFETADDKETGAIKVLVGNPDEE